MVAKQSSLTTGEQRKLAQHEEVISKGLHSFVDVGNALLAIQRDKLYTDVDGTFEGYCKKRWEFGKSHAYRLIESAKVITNLSPMGDVSPPTNERQARVLAELPDEQTQANVWARAVETAPKKDGKPVVTAAHVKKVAESICPKPAKPEPQTIDVPVSVEITTKPAKNGRPTVDIRKFTDLESHLGKAVRMNTEIKTACGGAEFHEAIRTCLNDALKHLADWKKSVGAA